MLERGDRRVEHRPAGFERPEPIFIAEAEVQLADQISLPRRDLYRAGSRFRPLRIEIVDTVNSREKLIGAATFILYKENDEADERTLALSIEIRKERGLDIVDIVTESLYLGLVNDEADRSDHGT
jgi:hypothetical protein